MINFQNSQGHRDIVIFKKNVKSKHFRDSESASLSDQTSPPHRFPNPRDYQDTTN